MCQKMSGTSETCGVTHDSLAAKEEDKKVDALSENGTLESKILRDKFLR